jgi:long-chain acyl-CoA synthetase
MVGPRLTEYYGFSEGGMTIATSAEWTARPGTVGRARSNQRLVILDDDGHEVETGVDGTIYVETADGVTFSYLHDEAKTAAAHRGSAFTVGDIGHIDDDGYLFITGRKSDVIVSAGVNIYPAEVESALSDTEGLRDLAIVGAPDAIRGEQVAAVLVTPDLDQSVAVAAALARTSAARLAGYKRPRIFFHATELPRDPTGKLLRNTLRDQVSRWTGEAPANSLVLIEPQPTQSQIADEATTHRKKTT